MGCIQCSNMARRRGSDIIDDGGDATLLIHKGVELENGSDWVNTPSDSEEEQVIKNLLKKIHNKIQDTE